MKVMIARATSEGEQINVEIDATAFDPKDWDKRVGFVLAQLDARIKEMATRYMDALKLAEKLEPAQRAAVKQAVDILYGGHFSRLQLVVMPRERPADGTGEAETVEGAVAPEPEPVA